ncbi:MAG: PEGA domain-containing protein [Myxococcaceae bacterium]
MKSALTAVLLCASTAFAGPADGDRLMNQGEFERALIAFSIQLKRKPPLPNSTAAKIYVKRAQCYAALQKSGPAREALKTALQLHSEVALDPAFANPLLLELMAEARASVQGDVEVTSELPDAEVRIDGRSVGPPPLKMSLTVGMHKVELATKDGAVRAKEVRVRYDGSARVIFDERTPLASEAKSIVTKPDSSDSGDDPGTGLGPETTVGTAPAAPVKAGPIAMVAGGGLAVIGGITCMAIAANVKAEWDKAQPDNPNPQDPTVTRADAERATTLFGVGEVALGVGAVVTGIGIYLLLKPDPSAPSANVILLPKGGGVVQVGGTF